MFSDLNPDDVRAAAGRIAGHVRHTEGEIFKFSFATMLS